MSGLRIESTRGDLVESVHRVSAAVVDGQGRTVAATGNPALVTFWRSAAKPFQAMPLVADGAADRFDIPDDELALCCASHSSEPLHLALAERLLARIAVGEEELACGPHVPLSPAVADRVAREGIAMTPRWNNCSGKHAGMLALCRHHGWPSAGYAGVGHPAQRRILASVSCWTDVAQACIGLGVDGCTAISFALPLRAMATAYARLGAARDGAAARVRAAMLAHPDVVAGSGRPCTDVMRAWPGEVLAKAGADGVYGAALPGLGLGLALKVEDGDGSAAPVALIAVLRELLGHGPAAEADQAPLPAGLGGHAGPAILNTRGAAVGVLRAVGGLRFSGVAPRARGTAR